MYDLNLFPISGNQEQPFHKLIGFQAAEPLRRPVRSRAEDRLIVYFSIKEEAQAPVAVQQSWLDRLMHTFYKTSGSVTSALRSLIETLNLTLMEQNLKSAQEGAMMTGAINLVAVHRRHLYFAQSGLTHAFTITHQGLQHFYDSSQMDRGLGLSRTPTIRYFQADLGTGGYLIMADTPLKTWTELQLLSDGYPNLEQLRRRLLNQAPPDFRLGLVQIVPGDGHIHTIQPTAHPVASDGLAEPAAQPQDDDLKPEIDIPKPGSPDEHLKDDTQEVVVQPTGGASYEGLEAEGQKHDVGSQSRPETHKPGEKRDMSQPGHEARASAQTPSGRADFRPEPGRVSEKKQKATTADDTGFKPQWALVQSLSIEGLTKFFAWWRRIREKASGVVNHLIARWLPEGGDGLSKPSRGTYLLIAVIVPLLVVAFSVGIYLSRGRAMQYQYYFDQAAIASQSASALDDPIIARQEWIDTLNYLDQAAAFRETDELEQLRKEAQIALDYLDGAIRVSFHPAIMGALSPEINITRIVSYGPDLYLLDAAGGRVIHATRESQGYTVNDRFVCASGNFGGGRIEPLVDMVSLPINNPYQAHLLVIDSTGTVAYCAPGMDPVVQRLPSAQGSTGEITRIAFENNHLFALNPTANTIRVYKSTNGRFLDAPFDFFERENFNGKPDITAIIDLAVNGAELYLLRADGQMVDCVSTGLPGNPLICEKPVFEDGRPGKDGQPVVMPESSYVSLLYTPPPDPAISILDATHADIYRFSLRFRLHQRVRSELGDYEVDSPLATGFTIGIDRIGFIAFGHQVFYGYVD